MGRITLVVLILLCAACSAGGGGGYYPSDPPRDASPDTSSDIAPSCLASQTLCGGVCRDLASDDANCGACGAACSNGQTCMGGACTCQPSLSGCGGRCVDTQSDNANCAACGRECQPGQNCVGGACVTGCPAPNQMCGDRCTSVSTDATNCGGCGRVCPTSQACIAGACTCPSGRTACGDACVNTNTDPSNCGACGNRCVAGVCGAGVCTQPPSDGGASDVSGSSCGAVNLGSAIGTGIARGSTAGRPSSFTPPGTCVMTTTAPSPDAAFAWTAPTSATYTFDTVGSAYDTVLALRGGSCDGPLLDCNDDIPTAGTTDSRLTVALAAGQTVFLIVDGYNACLSGCHTRIRRGHDKHNTFQNARSVSGVATLFCQAHQR